MSPLPRVAYLLALGLGALPLWVSSALPMVDLPQHLHLIGALHRLDDPTTLYPALLSARGELTPYLVYYYAVSWLSWLFPLELANRLFLTACVVGLPASLGFLLAALGRPRWASLLALPFAYGDSFGWGFINYLSAIPLAFVAAGAFVRSLTDDRRRLQWALLQGVALVLVLLSHVQVFAFLGLALPALLLMTAPGVRGWLKGAAPAVASTLPAVALFVGWVLLRLGAPQDVELGADWKAWGPMLSPQNLSFKSAAQNWTDLGELGANLLRSRADRIGLVASISIAALAWLLWPLVGLKRPQRPREGGAARRPWDVVMDLRLPTLAALALAMFFLLPFDIRGYMYYLNSRFVHLVGPLALTTVPWLPRAARSALLGLAVLSAAAVGLPLADGFRRFDAEARALRELDGLVAARPRLMGLIFDPSSAVVRHPVFLHAAAELARRAGGITNFSFALTPHSPLRYQATPPPTFSSEWRPHELRYEREARAYDHYLIRGASPGAVFGGRISTELEVVAERGGFWLVRRPGGALAGSPR